MATPGVPRTTLGIWSNKSAIAADAQSFATQIVQYYKTPLSQGGAGGGGTGTAAAMTPGKIAAYIGWDDAANAKTKTDSGTFQILSASPSSVVIEGFGDEKKGTTTIVSPIVTTTVALPAGEITAVVDDAATATTPTIPTPPEG